MRTYQAVFFDLFHTLVDVARAPGAKGAYTADILGVDRKTWNEVCFSGHHDVCRPTEHIDVIRTLAHQIDPSIPERRISEAAQVRQQRFDHALVNVEKDIVAALSRLKKNGYFLTLISNASTGEVAAWNRSPLAPLFDVALFSCDCGYRKPQPEIYRLALEKSGVTPEQALFVGDGGSDEHQGAQAAGIDNVLVTHYIAKRKNNLEERRAFAKWEIAAVPELVDRLLGAEFEQGRN